MPWNSRPHVWLAIGLMTAGIEGLSSVESGTVRSWDAPTPQWSDGPVKYLLTADEARVYRKAKDEGERSAFVARFWSDWDPTPGTEQNEFHEHFSRRVDEANEWFKEGDTPGWSTDRGRILLIAGYPDRRDGASGAEEVWVYNRSFPRRPWSQGPER